MLVALAGEGVSRDKLGDLVLLIGRERGTCGVLVQEGQAGGVSCATEVHAEVHPVHARLSLRLSSMKLLLQEFNHDDVHSRSSRLKT